MLSFSSSDTIVALSTPPGQSALAVIRMTGNQAIAIADHLFSSKSILEAESHRLYFGKIKDEDRVLDEVVIGLFRAPASYTGEDIIEITCHGSTYIIQEIITLCIKRGARMARAGEFSQRAFYNGKLDLSQTEAVADLIASENSSQHQVAMMQMRGGYSDLIKNLRQELIDFAALLELELDFSEEDIEFANRDKLVALLKKARTEIQQLINSFTWGNVIKKGIPVAIVGKPNAGKSTLLNALLNEEKAIVSDIPGTTRDFIEDTLHYQGITLRFIDTAGIRETNDVLENLGIERSYEKMKQASLVLAVLDINDNLHDLVQEVQALPLEKEQQVILVLNKSDSFSNLCNAYDVEEALATLTHKPTLEISAKQHRNIDKLLQQIASMMEFDMKRLGGDLIVSNARHWEALREADVYLKKVQDGLHQKISGEFISIDMRAALQALGSITGQVSNEDVLSSVFSRFCIGK